MTWIISLVMALGILTVLVAVCVGGDEFINIFPMILCVGIATTVLTLVMHLLIFG